MQITAIAYYNTIIKGKFGLPRQAGIASHLRGTITLCPGYKSTDALRGLEDFDYLWVIWGFNLNPKQEKFESTVRPPRLGGNKRLGVFATRSPFRPNGLGLSSLKIESINYKDFSIEVSGADLADGTEIFDIKPYIEYADSHTGIRSGFVDKNEWKSLEVTFSDSVTKLLTDNELAALRQILSSDPRPQYHNDPNRVYSLSFDKWDFSFTVDSSGKLYCYYKSL